MTFLEPCNKGEYFGTEQFHLRLLKTVPAQPQKQYLPAYLFEMVADGQPVGRCTLRVGHNDLIRYAGNIGYEVEEEHRGHHYALTSCRLLLRLARHHRMEEVLLTCRENNLASKRTCEQLGATLAGRVDVPVNHEMYREDSDAPLLQYRYRLGLELRPIAEQELVEVGKLYECVTADQLAGENYSGWDTEYPKEWTARELFAQGGLYGLFEQQTGQLVASAAYDSCFDSCYQQVRWSRTVEDEKLLCVHTLAVHPDWQGLGLGRRLMRFAQQQAQQNGMEGVRIDTWVGNLPGLHLYHRLGFADVQTLQQDVHYEGDRTEYQFLEWYCQ